MCVCIVLTPPYVGASVLVMSTFMGLAKCKMVQHTLLKIN